MSLPEPRNPKKGEKKILAENTIEKDRQKRTFGWGVFVIHVFGTNENRSACHWGGGRGRTKKRLRTRAVNDNSTEIEKVSRVL